MADFDPGTLGLSPSYVSQVPQEKFPYIGIGGYGTDYNGVMFGDRAQDTDYYSWDANASMSKLWGRHTAKFGLSYRKIGMKNTSFGQDQRRVLLRRPVHGRSRSVERQSCDPHALAAFLLGVPSNGDIPVATRTILHRLLRGVCPGRFPDQPEADRQRRLALRVRAGTAGEEQRLHRRLRPRPGLAVPDPRARRPDGTPLELKGGLMYAGVDDYPTHQSDPSHTKFAPRAGFAWSVNPKTVVRGGYGLFWAPYQYAFPNEGNMGARGFAQITDYVAKHRTAAFPVRDVLDREPLPERHRPPSGSANGLLTGAGGTWSSWTSSASRRTSTSTRWTCSASCRAARGGSATSAPDRADRRGRQRLQRREHQPARPAFHESRRGPAGPGAQSVLRRLTLRRARSEPTITRGQLLRPYPQFGDSSPTR